jgi:hypothetical protein
MDRGPGGDEAELAPGWRVRPQERSPGQQPASSVVRGICQPLGMTLSAHSAGRDDLVPRGIALEIFTLAWI